MDKETIKQRILDNINEIVDVLNKGNTTEIKVGKEDILILETKKKKIK